MTCAKKSQKRTDQQEAVDHPQITAATAGDRNEREYPRTYWSSYRTLKNLSSIFRIMEGMILSGRLRIGTVLHKPADQTTVESHRF